MPNFLYSQRVGSEPAIIGLTNVNAYTNDATLTFQIDCRMADCIMYVEINDFDKIKGKKNFWDKIHDFWWFKILKIYDFEVSHTFSSIGERVMLLNAREVINKNSSEKLILLSSEDITERKKAEQEIKHLKDFYERILNKIPSDLVVFDSNHKYLFINEVMVLKKLLMVNNDYLQ